MWMWGEKGEQFGKIEKKQIRNFNRNKRKEEETVESIGHLLSYNGFLTNMFEDKRET